MKRLLSGFAFLLSVLTLSAGPVSREQAQGIAKSFFEQKGIEMQSARMAFNAPKAGNDASEEAYYYVFNAGGDNGFVIVSGDDRTAEVLGYSETGSFNESNITDNMRSWLQYYADRIRYIVDNDIEVTHETKEGRAARRGKKVYHSIAPILTCNWNQGDPYNLKCPMYYNEDGSTGEHAATGCVATAIAQVLYHHKFPAQTKMRIPGMANSYDTPEGRKTVSLPGIKAGTIIDWDNMQDNYTGNETQEEKDAVAELMLIVGQAVKMGYGASSGSSYAESRKLFVDYLGYDDGVRILRSDHYGITEWFDMMYDELALGYPIGYGGSSTGGGHAFVVDGFDGDEFFHLNWGWGGGSNGYFRIDVLNPGDNSGIGASSSADGYSMGQDAIMYLRPYDNGIDETLEPDVHASINDTQINGTKIFSNYVNWTGSTNSFDCAIVMQDNEGNLTPVSNIEVISNLGANYYVGKTFDMAGKFNTPGTYHITPANKVQGKQIWRTLYDLKHEYIIANVDENLAVTLQHNSEPIDLEVAEWSFPGTLKAGEQQDVVVKLKNNGLEFKRELALYASKTNDMGGSVSRALIGVKSGDTDEFAFFFNPGETGTWNLWLTLNSDRNTVIGQTTVAIGNTAKNKANLAVSSVSVSNNAYGDCLIGTMAIKNNDSKPFCGEVQMQVWTNTPGEGNWWSGSSMQIHYEIPAGGTASAPFEFRNLTIGKKYRFNQRYVGQDGELAEGGVFNGSEWELKAGYLTWGSTGTISGAAVTSTVNIGAPVSGALFNGVSVTNIKANSNPNTIYAFTSGAQAPSSLDGHNVVSEGIAEEISLNDSKPVYSPVDFVASKASFSHTFALAGDGKKGWEAITLPFRPTRATIDGEEVAWKRNNGEGQFWLREFSELSDDNEVVFTDVKDFASLRGNTPYIIAAPEEMIGKTIVFEAEDAIFHNTGNENMLISSEAFQFYGMTFNKRIGGIYILNETGDAYIYQESNKTINAFQNYFIWKLDAENRPESILIYKEGLGIKDVDSTALKNNGRIYDLQGREVKNPSNGIYIINGKKTIINK